MMTGGHPDTRAMRERVLQAEANAERFKLKAEIEAICKTVIPFKSKTGQSVAASDFVFAVTNGTAGFIACEWTKCAGI